MSDSFSAFKFHSYTPNRTIIPPSSSASDIITSNPYCLCAHCTNLFSFNVQHLGCVGEEVEGITSNSRWNPTPAQLLYLEQLYTQGTKTPTAQQIQLITSQLRRFGNIQAKNVFYWFQNHKARDRQKRRRCDIETFPPTPPPSPSAPQQEQKDQVTETLTVQSTQHARQGLRGTGYEVKGTNKWASSSSNCSALAQVSDSLNRADGGGAYRSTKREERETQILRIKREESQEATCQIRDFFLSNSKHLIKSITTQTTTNHVQTSNPTNYYIFDQEEEEVPDDRTLKLFPLKRSDEDDDEGTAESSKHKVCFFNIASMHSDEINSNQFFEFLPLRN